VVGTKARETRTIDRVDQTEPQSLHGSGVYHRSVRGSHSIRSSRRSPIAPWRFPEAAPVLDTPLSDQETKERERQLAEYLREVIAKSLDVRDTRARGAAEVGKMADHAVPLFRCLPPGEAGVRLTPSPLGFGRTVVEILAPDQPFLVDTLRMNLHRLGLREALLIHPVLAIDRDEDGTPVRFGTRAAGRERESYLMAEVSEVTDPSRLQAIQTELEHVFAQARHVVQDHSRMVKALRKHTAEIEFAAKQLNGDVAQARELVDFLSWVADDNYVFLGYRRYEALKVDDEWEITLAAGSGLGLMRSPESSRFSETARGHEIPILIRARLLDEQLVFFDKSRASSTIHRNGRLDCLSVKLFDESGHVAGFGNFIGLLTHNAVRTRGSVIPLLRQRRERVLEAIGARPGSHTYKGAIEAFDSLPLEFLFPFPVEEITSSVQRVLDASEKGVIDVAVVPDPLNRSFFVSVIVPRTVFRDPLRGEVRRILEKRYGDGTQQKMIDLYGSAFPDSYRRATPVDESLRDVEILERLRAGTGPSVEVAFAGSEEESLRAKVYQSARPYLTDLLPVFDHFGLRVIDATLVEVSCPQGAPCWITTFRIEPLLRDGASDPPESKSAEDCVLAGLAAALAGTVESDVLDRLILSAGLHWRQVDLIRTYLAYAQQLRVAPQRAFAAETLIAHPAATRGLLQLFEARFDPAQSVGSREADAESAFAAAREPIATAEEDRVFGLLESLVLATLRTNFFFGPQEGAHTLVLKLRSNEIPGIPSPRPHAEIFVHAADMSGVHLRGGPVARGGIRWSDRQDFRTEVLGLMKTQMVKNGLIVPVGSKGGFVIKRRFIDSAKARVEADLQYARFVRALLSVTDNPGPDGTTPPPDLVRRDGDDPYLVVAADKGTAHLSDVANHVSEEEGFWLGDAFASGGSEGYDHKVEGITARGAWACVERHFLELGIDVAADVFTASGIGDMAGDVFGNGLLLARKAKLLAAFNHRHIFLDPDPDPETSWAERKRLFELPRSSWTDYDTAKISKGGGVYERSAREIRLSSEARAILELEDAAVTGEELVRAILRMSVDLFWNGGIGTYVKASSESHDDAADRANDNVRIDATEMRARVVGEGGNLGFTQLARIELALGCTRINTDALDNSGGVDLSDHEVNFKVLLAAPCSTGRLTRDERNQLLRECVEEANGSVLAHNAAQSRCVSMDLLRGEENSERIALACEFLESQAGLDRENEFLGDAETVRARITPSGDPAGYTRPEISVMLGYTKMLVKRELAEAEAIGHAALMPALASYFPEALRERFPEEVANHPLRHEITATCLTNRVIDQAGITLVPELSRTLGVGVPDVVLAYHVADRVLEADHLRWAVAAQSVPEKVRLRAALRIEEAVRDAARSQLGLERRPGVDVEEISDRTARIRKLRDVMGDVLSDADSRRIETRATALADLGLDPSLAVEIERLPVVARALGILHLDDGGPALRRLMRTHSELGRITRIAPLLDRLHDVDRRGSWERACADGLYLEMLSVQRALTERVLADNDSGDVAEFESANAGVLASVEELWGEIEAEDRHALAPVMVLAQQIRRLV